jgi:ubiquinone/menaquinone biosynthesis C-methylase UbiE
MKTGFLFKKPTTTNLDRFVIRKGIEMAVTEAATNYFHGRLLDIGCGEMPYREAVLHHQIVTDYVGIDIESSPRKYGASPDYFWDGETIPFGENTFDSVLLTEVLEHVENIEPIILEVARVLKSSGITLITVPFLWPLHESPFDFSRPTPFLIEKILDRHGFDVVVSKATGGWHASMAQMLGLWVRRGVSSKFLRALLSVLVLPLFKLLVRRQPGSVEIRDGLLAPGFYFIAKKR